MKPYVPYVPLRSRCRDQPNGRHKVRDIVYYDRRGEIVSGLFGQHGWAATCKCIFCDMPLVVYRDTSGTSLWETDDDGLVLYQLHAPDIQLVDLYVIQESPF